MSKIYFISGVNGVGKSSIMPFLRTMLGEQFAVVDFDSRGVPDGADRNWRIEEAQHWIQEGIKANAEGKELIVCGFVKPQDFTDIAEHIEVKIFVLDANEATIEKRLIGRYTKNGVFDESQKVIGKPIREFINGNIWYAKKMREESAEDGLSIIDTSNLTPEKVAERVSTLIIK